MAKTVDEGFRTFHSRLTPTGSESLASKSHRASIEACLKSNFEITRFWRTGSFGNGTSISGYSDVDYFASIPAQYQRSNSTTMLAAVRDVLDARFPLTFVHVDTPAVVAPFGSSKSEWTEIVPAYLVSVTPQQQIIYDIANGADGWKKSSPDTHNGYVTAIDAQLKGKLKPLIRFIKAWKCYRNVPVSSFYLELRVAMYAASESVIIYSWDVKGVLERLWSDQLAAIQDPMGISGVIHPCGSAALKEDSLSKLLTAFVRAEKAREAEAADKIAEAFTWWDLLYDGHFPSHG